MDHVDSYQSAMQTGKSTFKSLQRKTGKITDLENLKILTQESTEFLDTIEHRAEKLHDIWDSYRYNSYYRALTREVRTLRKEISQKLHKRDFRAPYYRFYSTEQSIQATKDEAETLLNILIQKASELGENDIVEQLSGYDAQALQIDGPWPV